jgi:hypothetical protein
MQDAERGHTALHKANEEANRTILDALRCREEGDLTAHVTVGLGHHKQWIQKLEKFPNEKQRKKKELGYSTIYVFCGTVACLVVVWTGHENDGALLGDIESAPGADFAEEDVGDNSPEDDHCIVRQRIRAHRRSARKVSSGRGWFWRLFRVREQPSSDVFFTQTRMAPAKQTPSFQ